MDIVMLYVLRDCSIIRGLLCQGHGRRRGRTEPFEWLREKTHDVAKFLFANSLSLKDVHSGDVCAKLGVRIRAWA